jgi:hypothetical protein
MKIISTNRSDTFDEYLRIISRYNENNLVKEAGIANTALNIGTDETRHLAGRTLAEIGSGVRAGGRLASVTAEELAAAGLKNADEIADIFEHTGQIFGKERANYLMTGQSNVLVRDASGKLRLPTNDEFKAVAKRVNDTGEISPNANHVYAGVSPRPNIKFEYIRNPNRAIEASKEMVTGSPFKDTTEATKFKNLTGRLHPDEAADAARAATEAEAAAARSATEAEADAAASGASGATGSGSRRSRSRSTKQVGTTAGPGSPVINNINNNTINVSDAIAAAGGRAGGSILDTSKLATREQLTSMRTFFRKSFEGLSTTVADLPAKIDELLKTRNAELIAELGTKIDDSVKASLGEVTTKVDELSKTVQTMDANISAINANVKNLEGQVAEGVNISRQTLEGQRKAAEEMVAMRKQMADSLEEMKKMKNQLEESIKASRVAVSEATPTVTKVTWWTKTKNFLVAAAAIAAAVAGSYWLYNKLTGENEESEGGGNGSGNTAGTTGVPEDRNDSFKNQMDDPARREALMDNVEKLNGEKTPEGTALLNRMADHYQAAGFVKLDNPISIDGMQIKYVFPVKVSGGGDPVNDRALRYASKSYMNKIYIEEPDKYIYTTTRFASSAGSSDPQKIANYAFSIIAGDKQFSSKGTLFGERGKRYGKGKRNVAIRDFGMAGTSQKNMTREEKRAIKNMNRMSDADDFMENDIDDPMQAFASGQNDFFHKKAEDINNSTNKYQSYEFAKKADKVSNRYFKDAIQDLQDDEFMKAYYSGFSKLHNEKPKKKKEDYEKLYDLHDETGADLVHEAHPKAITVAEAIGKGGLVENGSERSKAMEDIAFRVPSGNYRARYAFIQEALRKKS